MKIACIADQHGSLPEIPECDLLICAGDITGGNPQGPRDNSDAYWAEWITKEFQPWAKQAPTCIFIAGNHDTCLESEPSNYRDAGLIYLRDSWVTLGAFGFFGTPWVRKWDTLAFNAIEPELENKFRNIPPNMDVIISHGPPLGYQDCDKGSHAMREVVNRIKPKLLVCGHIHEARGQCDLIQGTKVVNAAGGFIVVEI